MRYPPNQTLHLTGAALLVSRDVKFLQRPRQVSLVVNAPFSLTIVYQVVGVDADFGHATPVILTGQTIGPFPAGATVNFKTIATNSAGTTESAVQTITLS